MAGRKTAAETAEAKQELAKKAGRIKKEVSDQPEPEAAQDIRTIPGTRTDGEPVIRLLRAEEIECRVSTINERGLSLLLFKDARVDQKILDETFTPFGWKRTHQVIDGNLYCTVEIWDERKGQWIAKQDVGTTSYSEKEKGQASDSFKRACFNWGLGRELYTAPFIWIPASDTVIQRKENRYVTADRFSVSSISYNGQREISALVILNEKGTPVFQWKEKKKPAVRRQEPAQENVPGTQMEELKKELGRTGVSMEEVLARYQLREPWEMTPEIYTKALRALKRTKTQEAA